MKVSNKLEKTRNMITLIVIILTTICCIAPIISKGEILQTSMTSAYGEEITLYGKGIYARNSFSMATQAIAQDMVTLLLAVPCMMISLYFVKKKRTWAQFVLTGLLAYMLYTYMSYTFLMFYDDLFLVYVTNMSLSFYGFVISINLLLKNEIAEKLQKNMRTKSLQVFLVITGIIITLLWSGRIIPTIGNDHAPVGLDNYSTLVIQGLDLGIIVPVCFVISYLLKEKNKLGYILGPVIIIKAVTLVLAVLAMALYLCLSGEAVAPVEYISFGCICVFAVYFLVRILKQIQEIDKSK